MVTRADVLVSTSRVRQPCFSPGQFVHSRNKPATPQHQRYIHHRPDEFGGHKRQAAERQHGDVELMQIVGNLIQQDTVAGVAGKISRPGVDVLRQQARRAPLKIERMQNAVAKCIRCGKQRKYGSQPQSRSATSATPSDRSCCGSLDGAWRSIFSIVHGCPLSLVGSVLKGDAL